MKPLTTPDDVRAVLDRYRADNDETQSPATDATSEPAPAASDSTSDRKSVKAVSTVLVELALSRYYLGVTGDGEAFAVGKDGSHVARMLRGGKTGLRAELARAYFEAHERAAPQAALSDALLVLEGKCRDAQPDSVYLRVAERGGVSYIDLGDQDATIIRVTGDGWSVEQFPPVLFQRTRLTGALPIPIQGGELSPLWGVVNVAESDRPLVLAWLVHALISLDTPHPILSLFAEQGSGKSSATRILAELVDPSPVPLRKPPKDADGWVTAASGSWVVAIDNLSSIPPWLSDSMCRAVTGDGDVRRALYTDGELAVFAFRRCLLVNGIDLGAMRGDYAERSLVANLERIHPDARRAEAELTAYWDSQYAYVFGALLDLAAGVKAALPSVHLDSSPRMADFARTLAAVDRVLGTQGLDHYLNQARMLAVDSLDSDPLVVAVRARIRREFTGTAAELLVAVHPADENWRPPTGWPKDARAVSGVLKRNAPALRAAGWKVENLGIGGKSNKVRWLLVPPPAGEDRETTPSFPPFPSVQVSGTESGGSQGGNHAGDNSRHPPPGGNGGSPGGNRNSPLPPENRPSTSGGRNGGNGGNDFPTSRTPAPSDLEGPPAPCPECGFGGVPAGHRMHHDCRSRVELRGTGSDVPGSSLL